MKKHILFLLILLMAILFPIFLLIKLYPQKIYKIYNEDYQIDQDLQWDISKHTLKDMNYSCSGWVILPGVEQGYPVLDNKTIWLFDQDEKIFFKLVANQSAKRNKEVSKIIGDGIDYQSSGFSVSLNLKELDISNKNYDIYISYQLHNINHIINTNVSIIDGKLIQN